MRLPFIDGWQSLTAHQVLFMNHRFEVPRIDAVMIAAKVVDLGSIGDRTTVQLIGDHMGVAIGPAGAVLEIKATILALGRAAVRPGPIPASRFRVQRDIHSETLFQNLTVYG